MGARPAPLQTRVGGLPERRQAPAQQLHLAVQRARLLACYAQLPKLLIAAHEVLLEFSAAPAEALNLRLAVPELRLRGVDGGGGDVSLACPRRAAKSSQMHTVHGARLRTLR